MRGVIFHFILHLSQENDYYAPMINYYILRIKHFSGGFCLVLLQ
jgi:hypothetical protein